MEKHKCISFYDKQPVIALDSNPSSLTTGKMISGSSSKTVTSLTDEPIVKPTPKKKPWFLWLVVAAVVVYGTAQHEPVIKAKI